MTAKELSDFSGLPPLLLEVFLSDIERIGEGILLQDAALVEAATEDALELLRRPR